jgi:copper homeostasis protein
MNRSEQILIEGCVDSVVSAIAAERGGASRVELCSNLLAGVVTPSAGVIELMRSKISAGLHVMGRRLSYSLEELETRRGDIMVARKLGADGVVLGILDAHGKVDIARSRELVELARPLSVTCHRAFDMSADLLVRWNTFAQLEQIGF